MTHQTKLTADQFSATLFQLFVLDDETKVQEKDLGPYVINAYSQDLIFKKHIYFYLVALVAVALTSEFESRENISGVIQKFRQLANNEALKRWNVFENEADSAIETIGTSLGKLLFTDPKSNRVLDFEWGRDYLGQTMVDETNPASLFIISTFWKMRFISLMKVIESIEIIP